MNSALIYRPNNRKLTWVAFVCAITIDLAAITIAGNKPKAASVISPIEPEGPVMGTDDPPSTQIELLPPEQIPSPPDQDAFPQENSTSPPIRPRSTTPITPARSANIGTGQAMHGGSVKALALYAPRPSYPYEARRSGTTGSGVAQLTVNPAAGNVVEARMSQSTGSPILDSSTLSAFRRWRFRSGVPSNVTVPITYTLAGASY